MAELTFAAPQRLAVLAKRLLRQLPVSVVIAVVDGDGLSRFMSQAVSRGDVAAVLIEVHPADLHRPEREMVEQLRHEFGYGLVC